MPTIYDFCIIMRMYTYMQDKIILLSLLQMKQVMHFVGLVVVHVASKAPEKALHMQLKLHQKQQQRRLYYLE